MTKTQKLHSLLSVGFNQDDFQIQERELKSGYGQVGKLAIRLELLVHGYSKRFKCPECGSSHQVEVYEGRFFIGCDVDEFAEPLELTKEELSLYHFNETKLAEWINAQLGLPESVQNIADHSWYLGELQNQGKKRKVYLSHNPQLVPISPGRIVLTVLENQHQTTLDLINILEFVEIVDNEIVLRKDNLIDRFTTHTPIKGEVLRINDELILSQEGRGKKRTSYINFGPQTNGQFQHKLRIKPQAYNIIYHLQKLPSTNSRKSSAELEQAGGLAKNRRTITTRIGEVNKILTQNDWPELILTDSDGKHYINPNLHQPLHQTNQ